MFRHRNVVFCLFICILIIGASPIVAQTTDPVAVEENENPPAAAVTEETAEVPNVSDMLVPSLTRIALSLLAIIVVIYAVVYLLRRLSGNRVGGGRRNKSIQMVEQTYLAPKKSVCLLKMADRAVLVGVTDTQISMLTEMEWEAMPQEIQKAGGTRQPGFQGTLNDAVGRLFGAKNKGASGEQPV